MESSEKRRRKNEQDSKEEDGISKAKVEKIESPSPGRLVYVRRRVEVDTSKGSTPPQPKEEAATTTTATVVAAAESSPQGQGTASRRNWEERYQNLQMLLNKLNESDQTDHIQMLWSLSSAELSKHAVDLEKRSIQLSLEEAREMQRVAALNLLGRSTSNDGE